MDYFDQFVIQFSGLSNGKHRFEFRVVDQFFEEMEYAIVEKGDVTVEVELDKSATMITLLFNFHGHLMVTCDRCAIDYPLPVSGNERLILQFGDTDSAAEEDNELIVLSRAEYEFNIAPHIYDFLALSLPLRVLPCEEMNDYGICDQTVLQKLDAIQAQEDAKAADDPRWEKLRNLGNDSNENEENIQ